MPDLAIGYSLLRLLKLLGAGLLLTLMCAAMAFNWYHSKTLSWFQVAVGYFGVAFFGFMTCRIFRTMIWCRDPVVFVDRDGIRDTRLANEIIPWRSVRDMAIWQYRRQKIVVLKLEPVLARRFAGNYLKRVLSLMNSALGADGVVVNTGGLTMDAEALLDTCNIYRAAAARSGRAASVVRETERFS